MKKASVKVENRERGGEEYIRYYVDYLKDAEANLEDFKSCLVGTTFDWKVVGVSGMSYFALEKMAKRLERLVKKQLKVQIKEKETDNEFFDAYFGWVIYKDGGVDLYDDSTGTHYHYSPLGEETIVKAD